MIPVDLGRISMKRFLRHKGRLWALAAVLVAAFIDAAPLATKQPKRPFSRERDAAPVVMTTHGPVRGISHDSGDHLRLYLLLRSTMTTPRRYLPSPSPQALRRF